MTAMARTSSNSKLQTRLLVREGATKQQTRECLKKISRRKKNVFAGPGWGPDTGTDWPTVSRNVTLTGEESSEGWYEMTASLRVRQLGQ
jgi:hypothetical protein